MKASFTVMYFQSGEWKALSDTYATYNRAATIATALENRNIKTSITETVDVPTSVVREG